MEFSIEKLLFKPIAALAIILIFLWFIVNILGLIEQKFLKSTYLPYKKTVFFQGYGTEILRRADRSR